MLDIIEGEGKRAKNLMSPEPPKDDHPAKVADGGDALSSEGPQGNLDPTYDGPLPVFQWQVGPEQSPEAVKTKLSIGGMP